MNPPRRDRARPVRVIHAAAPIRICDVGGWTDTWFARQGCVCNIAVHPTVQVQIDVFPRGSFDHRVWLEAEGTRIGFDLEALPGRWPLLEAAIDTVGVPDDIDIAVAVSSKVPPGSATGTSAAVCVALLGAMDEVVGCRRTTIEVARAAHRIEVERLGLQSGVQDQLCSAHGGVCFVEMTDYPVAQVSPVAITKEVWGELERRLLLVFLGRPHRSSSVHEQVIEALGAAGEDAPALVGLRNAAVAARDALVAGDLDAFGRALIDNTALQRELHPTLVSADAARVIEAARQNGATGWKVNGAGGDGGSLTVLSGSGGNDPAGVAAAVSELDPAFSVIPVHIAREGLRVWGSPRREPS